ncbi:MAG: helix-turn-helix transcriptional regulator [Candidatus Aminicenantales bacterium]
MKQRSGLRLARRLADLSLYEVSKATGISVPHLSLTERGFGKLSPEKKAKLAEFFGYAPETLFGDKEGSSK